MHSLREHYIALYNYSALDEAPHTLMYKKDYSPLTVEFEKPSKPPPKSYKLYLPTVCNVIFVICCLILFDFKNLPILLFRWLPISCFSFYHLKGNRFVWLTLN